MSSAQLKLRFWGVRGSIPVSGATTLLHGGNTSCVSVEVGDQLFALDAGTGLRLLGKSLDGPTHLTLLLSHLHWDHLHGLPFFAPLFRPGTNVDVWCPAQPQASLLLQHLSHLVGKPGFPMGLGDLAGRLTPLPVAPSLTLERPPVRVTALPVRHPDPCFAFRLDAGAASVVYLTDHEHHPEDHAPLVAFCRGASVLCMDCMYVPEEMPERQGWGHSSLAQAADLARDAAVGRLLLLHHHPDHDDQQLSALEARLTALFPAGQNAREGLELSLPL
jgi:phosphoribosyl 1,2-cyclic phosphodiesterase